MQKNFKEFPETIENTVKIANMCDLEIKFNQSLLPKFDCPDGLTEDQYMIQLCDLGLKSRYGIIKDETG